MARSSDLHGPGAGRRSLVARHGWRQRVVPALEEREFRLKKALKAPVGRDSPLSFIFIDCPPSLGLLTVNALVAADHVMIPVQTEYYALEGLTQLMSTVSAVRERLNPGRKVAGLALTMVDHRTMLARDVEEEVSKHFP